MVRPVQAKQVAAAHGKFTASATLPAVTLAGTTMTQSVAPVAAGDGLAAGEDISVQPTAALPGGLNIAWWYVAAANTVVIGLSTSVTLGVGTAAIGWRVTAHR